jgi:hypothetical protein
MEGKAMTKRERDLLTTVTEMHTKMLEYLQRADTRQERQFRATLAGFQVLQEGQERIAQMLVRQSEMLKEMQAVTARVLEQSNQVLLQLGGSGSTH